MMIVERTSHSACSCFTVSHTLDRPCSKINLVSSSALASICIFEASTEKVSKYFTRKHSRYVSTLVVTDPIQRRNLIPKNNSPTIAHSSIDLHIPTSCDSTFVKLRSQLTPPLIKPFLDATNIYIWCRFISICRRHRSNCFAQVPSRNLDKNANNSNKKNTIWTTLMRTKKRCAICSVPFYPLPLPPNCSFVWPSTFITVWSHDSWATN